MTHCWSQPKSQYSFCYFSAASEDATSCMTITDCHCLPYLLPSSTAPPLTCILHAAVVTVIQGNWFFGKMDLWTNSSKTQLTVQIHSEKYPVIIQDKCKHVCFIWQTHTGRALQACGGRHVNLGRTQARFLIKKSGLATFALRSSHHVCSRDLRLHHHGEQWTDLIGYVIIQ